MGFLEWFSTDVSRYGVRMVVNGRSYSPSPSFQESAPRFPESSISLFFQCVSFLAYMQQTKSSFLENLAGHQSVADKVGDWRLSTVRTHCVGILANVTLFAGIAIDADRADGTREDLLFIYFEADDAFSFIMRLLLRMLL